MFSEEMLQKFDTIVKCVAIAVAELDSNGLGELDKEAFIFGLLSLLFNRFPKEFLQANAELFNEIENEKI